MTVERDWREMEKAVDNRNFWTEAKDIVKHVGGITSGSFSTVCAALGGVSALHHMAGHAEYAARYLGAAEAVLPYAAAAIASSAAVYGVTAFKEHKARHKVAVLREKLSLGKTTSKLKEKKPLEAVRTKEQTKEVYKAFSPVLHRAKEAERGGCSR